MDIASKINWVDVLVVILMLRMSYTAFRDGLSHEIFPFFATLFVVVLTFRYYRALGEFISANTNMLPELSNFLTFLVLVVVMSLVTRFLKAFMDKIVRVEWHPLLERFGGVLLGVLRAYIVTSLILTLLALMPLPYLERSIKEKSLTGKYVLMACPEIYSRVSRLLPAVTVPADKQSS